MARSYSTVFERQLAHDKELIKPKDNTDNMYINLIKEINFLRDRVVELENKILEIEKKQSTNNTKDFITSKI